MMTLTREDTGLSHVFEVVSVAYQPTAVATSHPVELGAEVTDHVQEQALQFQVEALVTDSPRESSLAVLGVELARVFLEQSLGKALTVTLDGEGTFRACILESFPHERTAKLSRVFSCRFRQIRIASAISIAIPARTPAPVASAGAPTEVPLGQQPVSAVPETSALFDLRALVSPFH